MPSHEQTSLTAAAARLARDLWQHPLDLIAVLIAAAFTSSTFLFDMAWEENFNPFFLIALLILVLNALWAPIKMVPVLTTLATQKRREEIALKGKAAREYLGQQIKQPLIRHYLPLLICLPAITLAGATMLMRTTLVTDFNDWRTASFSVLVYAMLFNIILLTALLAGIAALIIKTVSFFLSGLIAACEKQTASNFGFYIFLACALPSTLLALVAFITSLPAYWHWERFSQYLPELPITQAVHEHFFQFGPSMGWTSYYFDVFSGIVVNSIIIPSALIGLAWFNYRGMKRGWKALCSTYFDFEQSTSKKNATSAKA